MYVFVSILIMKWIQKWDDCFDMYVYVGPSSIPESCNTLDDTTKEKSQCILRELLRKFEKDHWAVYLSAKTKPYFYDLLSVNKDGTCVLPHTKNEINCVEAGLTKFPEDDMVRKAEKSHYRQKSKRMTM